MGFDCVFVDFGVSLENRKTVLKNFPYARIVPFIKSYKTILENIVTEIRTEFFWLLTDLNNYQNFDFDYIPEQFEKKQIHVWYSNKQKEGDTFLIPTKELISQIKGLNFLRDFRDINYHSTDKVAYKSWPTKKFIFDNLIDEVKKQKDRYVHYYYDEIIQSEAPSFWEDQKLYIYDKNKLNLLIPRFKFHQELYEYTPKYSLNYYSDPIYFDICYIHNGEPQATDNLRWLQQHLKNRPNKLHVIEGVKGRKQAYQTAARASTTEYFYATFAKLKIDKSFHFNFVPDTLKSPRHYIFDCYNPVINYTYGHQAVILYNKNLVLQNDGKDLDFTLAQKHDHIPLLSAETTFYTDPRVCYRTAFREIVKLMHSKKNKPTVENDFILSKWFNPDVVPGASYVLAAGEDAKRFVETHDHNFDEIFKSYEWEFVDQQFDQRYN